MRKKTVSPFLMVCLLLLFSCPAGAEQESTTSEGIVLKKAVMCEKVKDGQPVDQTILFDVAKGSAYCWGMFDPVAVDGVVYFEWYRKETLAQREKRAVRARAGGWATYSSLKLRQADIGPWHLAITDENGKILETLRFSITE